MFLLYQMLTSNKVFKSFDGQIKNIFIDTLDTMTFSVDIMYFNYWVTQFGILKSHVNLI